MVRIPTDIDPRFLPAAFTALTEIVPWSIWERRASTLRAAMPSNPVWESFLVERHSLELALVEARNYMRATRRWPWPPRNAAEYRANSFMAMAVRVYGQLSAAGKARLAGAMRSALESEAGLGPLAFEIKIVAQVLRRGFDLSFHDLENGGGFDFLAQRDGLELEIECKHMSADVGRQIHQRRVHALAGALQPVISLALDRVVGGRLLRVTLPGRLVGNAEQTAAINELITANLSGQNYRGDAGVCQLDVEMFPIADSPFTRERGHALSIDDVAAFALDHFGLEQAHMLFHWRPGQSAILVHFASALPDRVLDALLRRLREDSKRQLSGNRPGMLCVHLADVSQEQLRQLAAADRAGTVTGIQRAISSLLHRRRHLHTVALMTDGSVRLHREREGGRETTSVQEIGPTYVFRNPEHPQAGSPALEDIFATNSYSPA